MNSINAAFRLNSLVNANFSRLSWVGWNVLKNTPTHSSVDYNYSEQAHQNVQKSHSRMLENSDSSCKHDVPPWLLVLGFFYSTTRTRSDWRRSSSCRCRQAGSERVSERCTPVDDHLNRGLNEGFSGGWKHVKQNNMPNK